MEKEFGREDMKSWVSSANRCMVGDVDSLKVACMPKITYRWTVFTSEWCPSTQGYKFSFGRRNKSSRRRSDGHSFTG